MVTTVIITGRKRTLMVYGRDELFLISSGKPGLAFVWCIFKTITTNSPLPTPNFLSLFILVIVGLSSHILADDPVMWYRQPAQQWSQTLPIGNGRFGALIYGGVWHERIQFIECRTGTNRSLGFTPPKPFSTTADIRNFLTNSCPAGGDLKSMETLGELRLEFAGNTNQLPAEYRRQLDLDTALARTTFQMGDVTFTREIFANRPDQVMVIMIGADKRFQTYFTASFGSPASASSRIVNPDELLLTGPLPGDQNSHNRKFAIRLRIIVTSGKVETMGNQLKVTGADQALVVLSVATDSTTGTPNSQGALPDTTTARLLKSAVTKDYDVLRAEHIVDHQKWFRQTRLNSNESSTVRLPLDERLAAYAKGSDDSGLVELFFHYGRYLDKAFLSNSKITETFMQNQAQY